MSQTLNNRENGCGGAGPAPKRDCFVADRPRGAARPLCCPPVVPENPRQVCPPKRTRVCPPDTCCDFDPCCPCPQFIHPSRCFVPPPKCVRLPRECPVPCERPQPCCPPRAKCVPCEPAAGCDADEHHGENQEDQEELRALLAQLQNDVAEAEEDHE